MLTRTDPEKGGNTSYQAVVGSSLYDDRFSKIAPMASIHMYTDGSWIEDSTHFAFCAIHGDQVVYKTVPSEAFQHIVSIRNPSNNRRHATGMRGPLVSASH